MMSISEKDLIIDYILENKKNLEISLYIISLFNDVRKKIIMEFLKELDQKIRMDLDDEWDIKNELLENVFDRYRGFYITKKSWKGKYQIGICPDKYGAKGFVIGIEKGEESKKQIADGKLKELLDVEYRPGSRSDTWEWCQWLGAYQWRDVNLENWDNHRLLIAMYDSHERNELIKYIIDQIIRIKEISSPLIDESMIEKNE